MIDIYEHTGTLNTRRDCLLFDMTKKKITVISKFLFDKISQSLNFYNIHLKATLCILHNKGIKHWQIISNGICCFQKGQLFVKDKYFTSQVKPLKSTVIIYYLDNALSLDLYGNLRNCIFKRCPNATLGLVHVFDTVLHQSFNQLFKYHT